MKNAVLNLASFLLLASAFTACKKDKTFKDQLVGHWVSTQVVVGGVDLTNSYSYTLHLDNSLEFDMDVVSTDPITGKKTDSFKGEWVDDEAKQNVVLTYSSGSKDIWDVTSISDANLSAETIRDNVRIQIKFKRQ